MNISLTPVQEARLHEMADYSGKNVSELLTDAATTLLKSDGEHWAAVHRALSQADRGEFVEDEVMEERLARMLAR